MSARSATAAPFGERIAAIARDTAHFNGNLARRHQWHDPGRARAARIFKMRISPQF